MRLEIYGRGMRCLCVISTPRSFNKIYKGIYGE